MKKLLTRSLAVLLVMVMAFTAIPMNAFAQDQSQVNPMDEYEIDTSNALGNAISQMVEDQPVDPENAEYGINLVEVDGKVATVNYYCGAPCTLVVAIYTENMRMVATGDAEVTPDFLTVDVGIDIDEMPETFIVKAFLLDENMNALCDEYVNEHYTSAYQAFFEAEVDDFDQDLVLNLDEAEDNNFFVVDESAIIVYPKLNKNMLLSIDSEKNIYTFDNTDGSYDDLRAGRVLFYNTQDENFVLIKVDEIKFENNQAIIKSVADAPLEELFGFIKIDTSDSEWDATLDTETLDPGIKYLGQREQAEEISARTFSLQSRGSIDTEQSVTYEYELGLKFGNENAGISAFGNIDLTAKALVKCYYSEFWFIPTKLNEAHVELTARVDFGITLSAFYEQTFCLGRMELSFYKIIGIAGSVNLPIKANGSMGFNGYVERTFGFKYKRGEEIEKLNGYRYSILPSVETSLEISVGLRLDLTINAILSIVEGGITAELGVKFTITGKNYQNVFEQGDPINHNCGYCFDGDLNLYFKFGFTVKFIGNEVIPEPLVYKEIPLFSFYYSEYDGVREREYGRGECPYISYRTDFDVRTLSDEPIDGADVTVKQGDKTIDSGDYDYYYLPVGRYSATVSADNFDTVNMNFSVVKANTIKVNMKSDKLKSGKVVSYPTGRKYYTGDSFDPSGMKLELMYYDGRTKTATSGFSCSPSEFTKSGKNIVTISYGDISFEYEVDVIPLEITKAEVLKSPAYYQFDNVGNSDLQFSLTFNNGKSETVYGNNSGISFAPAVLSKGGNETITATYNYCTFDFDATSIPAQKIEVAALPNYYVGDSINKTTLKFLVTFADGTEKTISGNDSDLVFDVDVLSQEGLHTVQASYGDAVTSVEIDVIPVMIEKLKIVSAPKKLAYSIGESFDPVGLKLRKVYNNGDTENVSDTDYTYTAQPFTDEGLKTVTFNCENFLMDLDVFVSSQPVTEINASNGRAYITADNVAYIVGGGNVYISRYSTWESVKKQLKSVKIGEGITSVHSYQFDDCEKLTEITIPNGVESIGENAFLYCTSLTDVYYTGDIESWCEITFGSSSANPMYYAEDFYINDILVQEVVIPDTVTEIKDNTFNSFDCITTVTIPDSVESIGRRTFYNCNLLEKVNISKNSRLTSIGKDSFWGCDKLTEITIPDSVESIGDHAFTDCVLLEKVNISENSSLKSIEFYAFSNCDKLTEITIPDGVESIGYCAFYDCDLLEKVNISENSSLKSIEFYAFSNCDKLTEITIPDGVESIGDRIFYNCDLLEKVNISENSQLRSIGEYAFYNCAKLTEITIPGGVDSIGEAAFLNCTSLTDVYYAGDIESWCNITFKNDSGNSWYHGNPMYYTENFYINDILLKEVVIPDTVTEIKDYAFYDLNCITSVTIPDSVESIGSYAFYDCDLLEKVNIGENSSLKSIGNCAFHDCDKLTEITIPDSVESIGYSAFNFYYGDKLTDVYYTGSIESWCGITFLNISSNPMYYAENFYINDTLVQEVVIPDTVTEIKDYAFYGFNCITTVTIPDSVESIGKNAFSYCTSLTDVYYTGDIESWCEITFGSSSANPMCYAEDFYINDILVQEVVIPDTVTEIKDYAFWGFDCITTVTIPDSVESIGREAFGYCDLLEKVNIGENSSLKSIGDYAFRDCGNLTEITIPDGVESIGNYAFYSCSNLKSVEFEDNSFLKSIGEYGFAYCTALETIEIPENKVSIGYRAFYKCTSLKKAELPGDLSSMGDEAFKDCPDVEIDFGGSQDKWDDLNKDNPGNSDDNSNVNFTPSDEKYAVYTVSESGTIPGNRYTLLVFGNNGSSYDPDNLAYIETGIATSDTIEFSFIPKVSSGLKVVILGVFESDNGDSVSQPIIKEPDVQSGTRVQFVSLNATELNLRKDEEPVLLTAVVAPENASVKDVIWYSSDSSVVTVDSDGYVYPVGNGSAVITVETVDGKHKASCNVTVSADMRTINWIIDKETTITESVCVSDRIKKIDDPVREGYTFLGWKEKIPQIMPDNDLTFTAEWQINSYTVKWNFGDEITEETYDYGAKITAPEPPEKEGHTFIGWEETIPETMPAEDLEFTAKWAKNPHTVTWIIDGKEIVETYDFGDAIAIPVNTVKEGYTFDGWDAEIPSTMPDKDLVFTAKWKINTYTVTWNVDGEITVETYDYGAKITAPEPPEKEGHTLIGWEETIPETMPAEDLEFTAKWAKNPHTVTWIIDGKEIVETYDFGDAIAIPVNTVKEGYTFDGWDAEIPSTMPDKDLVFTAKWKINTYTVTWNVDGEITVETYIYGEKINQPAKPKRVGFTFKNWGEPVPETMPAENLEFTACWERTIHIASWMYYDSRVGLQNYYYGDTIVPPEVPAREGYTFIGWKEDIPKTMPDESLIFTAEWQINSYTIKWNFGDEITEESYDFGAKITEPEPPVKEGYTFIGWEEEYIPETMPSKNLEFTAKWAKNPHTVTWIVDDEKTVETYDFGDVIVVADAPAKEGYTFDGWDAEIPSTVPDKDLVFTAKWKVNSHTVTWIVDGEEIVETYDFGDAIAIPDAPAKEGYTFDEWDGEIPSAMPDKDLVFTAKWKVNSHTVTWIIDGEEIVETYDFGAAIAIPDAPAKEGYTFDEWDAEIPSAMPDKDLVFTAKWKVNSHTVTWIIDGKEIVETYDFGDAIVIPAKPVKEGYTFDGWDAEIPSAMPDKDLVFTAKWKVNSHTVTWIIDGKEIVETYDFGDAIVIPAKPVKEGYTFDGWDAEIPSAMPDKNLVFTAKWKVNSHTVTWIVDGKEIVETYDFGDAIAIPVNTVKEGYTFVGWDAEIPSAMPDKDLVFTAKWKVNSHTVTWIIDGKEIVETYDFGDVIVIPAKPVKEGYIFKGWNKTIPETMPANNLEFTAVFEKIVVNSVEVISMPTKLNYIYKRESIDLTGLVLEITYSDGTRKTIRDLSEAEITGFDNTQTGQQIITVEYEGQKIEFIVTVSYVWWQWLIIIFLFGWIWY